MEIKGNLDNFDNEISKGNILVDFYATWCGPCKMLSLELDKIKDDIKIMKVDIDENMELCKKYGVMSVPTLIYFKSKDDFKINVGYISSDEILTFIDKM